MITILDNYFKLDTLSTSYIFKVIPTGHLQHIYYGQKLCGVTDYGFIEERNLFGCGVKATKDGYSVFPDCASFECSVNGRGDFREPFVIVNSGSDRVNEFLFEGAEIVSDFAVPGLPCSTEKSQTLIIRLKDKAKKLALNLYYSLTDGSDVIVKSSSLSNSGENMVSIERLMSNQIDIYEDDFILDTLNGAWARERNISSAPLTDGITKIDSKYGFSSAMHNPYVVLRKNGCGYDVGECYGFNLIYSGNHVEYFDKSVFGKVRVLSGINDSTFNWTLASGETFFTPEATVCYSANGTNGLTKSYHSFVNNHIVRGYWKNRERPILCNNWEATGFDFDEEKIHRIAKRAAVLGIELFVLDDGWFGERTDETKGLGDWIHNKKRLPRGLKGLAEDINKIGLEFGIWVEPEMISPDSDLYRAHPEYAVVNPDYTPLLSRNQLVLDLCNPEVRKYILDAMTEVFSSANISYVKWDCNRNISECYSPYLKDRQGEFMHRYMLGLYEILEELVQRFPKILFESCAAGGNRADLGMLSYMPQFWASDNSDAYDRVKIQEGTLTCYPQSTIGAHVSASPNKQTLRPSTIENRFNTACIGAFGYEMDLSQISEIDTKAVFEQIKWYKQYRKTLQFGTYYRLKSVFKDRYASWIIVSHDKSQAVANVTNKVQEVFAPQVVLRLCGLDTAVTYEFKTRKQFFPIEKTQNLAKIYPIKTIESDVDIVSILNTVEPLTSEEECYFLSGDTMQKCGIRLNTEWMGGQDKSIARIMLDFGSRLYTINKVK